MLAVFKNFIYLFIDKDKFRPIVKFEIFISVLIVFNAISAGIMITQRNEWLEYFDHACTAIYCFEILVRYIACASPKKFFSDPLQLFDIIIILFCLIPETIFLNTNILLCLRVIRILRIARFITLNREMSTIIKVLLKSVMSLYKIMGLMLVFLYVFGIAGMSMFRMPTDDYHADRQNLYIEFISETDDYFAGDRIDPFGSVSESMLTLLKVITEQSWSSYRNSLIIASKMKIIDVPSWVVSLYFLSWFMFGAYLLLNLAMGAIIQNYDELYSKVNAQKREQQIHEKVEELVNELLKDLNDGNLSLDEKQRLIQKAFNIAKK